MRKKVGFILFLLTLGMLASLFIGNFQTFAEQDGGVILFKNTKKMRPVMFRHQKHLKAGNKCGDCHEKIFKKKKGSTQGITMRAMRRGKYCGTCHNGSKAFTVKHSCSKCHSAPR